MSIAVPNILQFLPEELRKTPFAIALGEAFQEEVADKVITAANQVMRLYDATHDRKSLTIKLVSSSHKVLIPEPFKPESLSVSVSGNDLLKEDASTLLNEGLGILVSTVNGSVVGSVDKATRLLGFAGLTPSSSAPITLEIQYDTVHELDFKAMSSLRKSAGLFIDTTGFQDDESMRRVIFDMPYFYEVRHSLKFVDYLSFVSNVKFKLSELYARVNAYPGYGSLVEYDQMIAAGFTQWAHEATLPANIEDINPATVANSVWYQSSLVILQYDDEAFFKDVGLHVNLFEKITKLFYQLAPIHLVLFTIQARRLRAHTFRWRCGIRQTQHFFIPSAP